MFLPTSVLRKSFKNTSIFVKGLELGSTDATIATLLLVSSIVFVFDFFARGLLTGAFVKLSNKMVPVKLKLYYIYYNMIKMPDTL